MYYSNTDLRAHMAGPCCQQCDISPSVPSNSNTHCYDYRDHEQVL